MDVEILPATSTSFFELTEKIVGQEPSGRPFHRVCEIMRKSRAQSIIVHRQVEKSAGFRTKYPHLFRELEDKTKSQSFILNGVIQVTFLTSTVPHGWAIKTKLPPNLVNELQDCLSSQTILATCVIVSHQKAAGRANDPASKTGYIYEAVVRAPTPKENIAGGEFPANYTHVSSEISIVVLDRNNLTIPGSYFVQGNGIDCVCAQACLKMSLIHVDRTIKSNLRLPPTSRRINELVEKFRLKTNTESSKPVEGLEIDEILHVIGAENARPIILDTSENRLINPYEFTYLLVESGIPAMVVFTHTSQTDQPDKLRISHIMPVAGHTLNGDKWHPIASLHYPSLKTEAGVDEHRYRSTAEWVCHLVIHDDYLGPYYCMTEEDLRYPRTGDGSIPKSRIKHVIGLVSESSPIQIAPYYIQEAASSIFLSNWEELLHDLDSEWKAYFENNPWSPDNLVLRTQIVEKKKYLKHLFNSVDHLGFSAHPSERKKIAGMLPETFWLTEFTLPEVFAINQATFGEVFIKASANEDDLEKLKSESSNACLAVRFVDNFFHGNGKQIDLGFKSHIPMFRRQ